MTETTTQRLNPEKEIALNERKINHNESYDEFPLLLNDQPERSKREDLEKCPEWGNCRTAEYDDNLRC